MERAEVKLRLDKLVIQQGQYRMFSSHFFSLVLLFDILNKTLFFDRASG